MNKNLQVAKYIVADLLTAALAWTIFFTYRKWVVDHEVFRNLQEVFLDRKLYLGILVIPFFWLILYIIIGTYRKIYRKSRLRELGQTLSITFIGVIFIFFSLLLDDIVISYQSYYKAFIILFLTHLTSLSPYR